MKNCEKFKTADERAKALRVFCNSNKTCKRCPLYDATDDVRNCAFHWLELEAEEEKPESCPFCHGECNVIGDVNHRVKCMSCNYESIMDSDRDKVVAAHNRVARAVKSAKEGEVK